jgi:hypothetical protein
MGAGSLNAIRLIEPCGKQSKGKDGAANMARMQTRIVSREAANAATVELLGGDSFEDRFAMLEREEQIATLKQNLKQDLRKDLRSPKRRQRNPASTSAF